MNIRIINQLLTSSYNQEKFGTSNTMISMLCDFLLIVWLNNSWIWFLIIIYYKKIIEAYEKKIHQLTIFKAIYACYKELFEYWNFLRINQPPTSSYIQEKFFTSNTLMLLLCDFFFYYVIKLFLDLISHNNLQENLTSLLRKIR